MTHRKPFLDRPDRGVAPRKAVPLVVTALVALLMPPVPLSADPPASEPGEVRETPDPRTRPERLEAEDLDPCDFGRLIALQPACTTPEDCTALRLWQGRMPQGPMAAIPIPRALPNVMPASDFETEPTSPSEPDPPTLVLKLEKEGDPDARVLAEKLGVRLRERGLKAGEAVEILALPYDQGRTRRYRLRVPEEGLAPDLLAEPRLEPEPGWRPMNPCPAGH